jgi:hypothetical protein
MFLLGEVEEEEMLQHHLSMILISGLNLKQVIMVVKQD